MATKTFADKVKAFLKGGDERKINKFHNSVTNIYKDDIELLERENKRLEEKLEEAKESKIDFVFNIDLDSIKSVDDRNKYAQRYAQNLLNFDNENVWTLEENIKENKEKIKQLKNLIKYIETVEPIIEEED